MAVKILTNLLKSDALSKYVRAQCHIYRGYGYMAMHDFDVSTLTKRRDRTRWATTRRP